MLRWRIVLGVLLIGALVALLWHDALTAPNLALFLVTTIVGLAAAQEVVRLFAAGGLHPLASVIYGGTLLVTASNAMPLYFHPVADSRPLERLGWPLLAFMASVLAALVGEMRRYRQPGGVMINVALATLGVAYVGLLLSFVLQLRFLGGSVSGMFALVALLAVVKFSDIGAYTVGRLVGRHKMAPVISPGKTWEGAGGAMVFACLGAWLVLVGVPHWTNWSVCDAGAAPLGLALLFGLVVGVAGIVGDLAESLFKRDMGVKDSSAWLPGFGGVLDLLDSILLAAPVAYVFWWLAMT